jgi:hypothetical protein
METTATIINDRLGIAFSSRSIAIIKEQIFKTEKPDIVLLTLEEAEALTKKLIAYLEGSTLNV